jgi:ribulose-bisphosphate carboxylase large chain
MQEQYVALGNKDVYNGEYMLAAFKILRYGDKSLIDAASEVASESSTGSNLKVGSATNFSQTLDALVYEVDEENDIAFIAYPWRIFDSGGNIQNILTFIAGNVFGMSNLRGCKILDVQFPPQMLTLYNGPATNLHDMRDYLNLYDSPVLGTIIKPKIGLTPNEYAELCYDFWIGGGHFVKNDEPQADQSYAPFTNTVDAVRNAMDMAESKTGHTKVHSFNVSAPDFDTMIRRADYVQKVMKPGSYAFLVDGITAGWTAIQTIRNRYPEVFLHFHRAGHGAFTRKENPFGFTVSVMTKFARLAGASGIHTGTAGVGKMDGDPHEDVMAMHHALRIESQGDHFKQVWSTIPHEDSDIEVMIKSEQSLWNLGPREMSNIRKDLAKLDSHHVAHSADWRTIKSMSPIVSGGMNPVLIGEFIETVGTIDFIITMGGGIHSHPMKTTAGTQAVKEAFNAWQEGLTLHQATLDNKGHDLELESAIRYFDKHGTQAHRIPQDADNNQ